MRFGYFANQNNRNGEKPYGQVLSETIKLAQYMGQNDWSSIWFTKHHFGHEGFEVCLNPVLMSTWAAAHTKRLRLGQAANIITFWNPLRFAEDLAMLDHMSGGRVEGGIGRGIYGCEAINLNKVADTRNPEQNLKLFRDSLEVIKRAWTGESFEFDGEMMTIPESGVCWGS